MTCLMTRVFENGSPRSLNRDEIICGGAGAILIVMDDPW